MALADRRMVGARWLAYSVVLELLKVVLQALSGRLPPTLTEMVANELNLASFFSMYMGFRWFVLRQPLASRIGPAVVGACSVVYAGMYLESVPYSFHVGSAPVLGLCAATVGLLLTQKEERFRLPAVVVSVLLSLYGLLLSYRMLLAAAMPGHGAAATASSADPHWTYSMLGIIVLSNCLLLMYVWFAVAEMYSTVEASAGLDALTGCMNRRALMKLAAHELARSERTGMPLGIVAVDLDHFKNVNDTYGHAAGDMALCAVVGMLRTRLRSADVVARLGGEEFLLLLPDTDAVSAAGVMQNLLQAVAAMPIEYEGSEIHVTISAGVTQRMPRGDTWTAMLKRSDRALYQAKATGRNRVVLDEAVMTLPRRPAPVRSDVVSIERGVSEASSIRQRWMQRG
ncbi:MAG: GGDEF domain-containing protein [Acidobacteriota bacterium]|nr:GGDEF domain-containing protein [Acidobacteriota bacterium]